MRVRVRVRGRLCSCAHTPPSDNRVNVPRPRMHFSRSRRAPNNPPSSSQRQSAYAHPRQVCFSRNRLDHRSLQPPCLIASLIMCNISLSSRLHCSHNRLDSYFHQTPAVSSHSRQCAPSARLHFSADGSDWTSVDELDASAGLPGVELSPNTIVMQDK